jgi:hypothetical protein
MLLKMVTKSKINSWTLNFPTDPNQRKSQILFYKKEPIAGLYNRDFCLCTFAVVACNYFKCWLRFATQWSKIKNFIQKLKHYNILCSLLHLQKWIKTSMQGKKNSQNWWNKYLKQFDWFLIVIKPKSFTFWMSETGCFPNEIFKNRSLFIITWVQGSTDR